MRCKNCKEVKLSNEFPPSTLTDNCDHPALHCLRCVIAHWENHKTCSQCNQPVEESCLSLRQCYARIETLFPQITFNEDDDAGAAVTKGNITITRLNGESFETPYNPNMSVFSLKKKIEKFMNVPPEKQNLMYNQRQIKEYREDHSALATLGDNGVKPSSVVHLLVLLYAVPDYLDKVVFDLYWGYPYTGRDYLDACADVFNGQDWIGFVDFDRKKLSIAPHAIVHSRDMMDDFNRQGHHIINVSLKKIPAKVTHVFFTLCTWKAPTISRYPNPSMKFYEESKPDTMLCTEQISKGNNRQAIVMCSLMRKDGQWLVHSNGTPSDGNNCKYEPILTTIQKLIAQTGDFPHVPFHVNYGASSHGR